MGFGSFIAGAISTVGSFIVGAAGHLGAAISGVAGKLTSIVMGPLSTIPLAMEAIGFIGKVLVTIAEHLGIIKPKEEVDELAAKAMQPEAKSRDEFDSTSEYIEYLRNEIELDRDKFDRMSPEERLACKATGVAMVSDAIKEKTGIEITPEFMNEISKNKLTVEEVEAFIDSFKEKGFLSMGDMVDYLSGKCGPEKSEAVNSAIGDAIHKTNPTLTEDQVQDKIYDFCVGSEN